MMGEKESKETANLALELVRGGCRVQTQNITQRTVDSHEWRIGAGCVVLTCKHLEMWGLLEVGTVKMLHWAGYGD
jgi:hypothetical protein